MKKVKINWRVLVLSLFTIYSVGGLGSIFTSIDSQWYESVKPSITPPGWVFPIVWNILFFMIALSLYSVWINSKKNVKRKIVLVFGINLFFNFLWTIFYFGMQNPLFAFFDLIFLWISIIMMIVFCYKVNKISAYLLIPYFLWVSFAGVLNFLSI